jgi:hypothetical protein
MQQAFKPLGLLSSSGSFGRRNPFERRAIYSVTECNKYGRQHSRVCRFSLGVCLGCGKPGHHIRNYPIAATRIQGSQASNNQPRQAAQARVYSLTPNNIEAEENATDIVSSTISLFGRLACILFDSSATRSFI